MAGEDRLNVLTSGMNDLVALHDRMGENDHLVGSVFTLYAKQGDQISNNQVGFRTASSYGDAKANVRRIIAKQVGGKKADEIMDDVLKYNPRFQGLEQYCLPDRTAMTKTQLSEVLNKTYQATTEQLSFKQRDKLIARLETSSSDDVAELMKDKQISSLVHLAAEDTKTAQDAQFLDAVLAFEKHVEDGSSLARLEKLGFGFDDDSGDEDSVNNEDIGQRSDLEVPAHAEQIRATFLDENAQGSVHISSSLRKKLDVNFDALSLNELKNLFTEAKAEVAQHLRTNTIASLVEKLKGDVTEHGTVISYDNSHVAYLPSDSMEKLVDIKGTLRLGDRHLRQQGKFLYTKDDHLGNWLTKCFSHATPSLNPFSKRSGKFQRAKLTVQKHVQKSLQELGLEPSVAKQMSSAIMRPWLSNSRALRHADLEDIIDKINQLKALQDNVKTLPQTPQFKDSLNPTTEEGKYFGQYLELIGGGHGRHELDEYHVVGELSRTLRTLQDRVAQSEKDGTYWFDDDAGVNESLDRKASLHPNSSPDTNEEGGTYYHAVGLAQQILRKYEGGEEQYDILSFETYYIERLRDLVDHPGRLKKPESMSELIEYVGKHREKQEQHISGLFEQFCHDCCRADMTDSMKV